MRLKEPGKAQNSKFNDQSAKLKVQNEQSLNKKDNAPKVDKIQGKRFDGWTLCRSGNLLAASMQLFSNEERSIFK